MQAYTCAFRVTSLNVTFIILKKRFLFKYWLLFYSLYRPFFITEDGKPILLEAFTVFQSQSAYFWAAIVIGFFFSCIGVLSLILLYWKRNYAVPKTAANILHSFLDGVPKGSVMISYTARENNMYKTEKSETDPVKKDALLPRVLARLLPCRWLDEDFLITGGDLEAACFHASKQCLLAVIFLSDAYISRYDF